MGEKPWHEQNQFWETVLPIIFPKERSKAAIGEINHILSLIRPKKGATVLDAGCGIGRHSLELAKKGFQVTALDRTAIYLKIAKNEAREKRLYIKFIKGDIRQFCPPNVFDVIFNLFTTFGYFSDAENLQVLRNFYKSLKPRGQLVIEMTSSNWVKRNFVQKMWHSLDGRFLLEERRLSKDHKKIDTIWILTGKKKLQVRFSHRIYSAPELKAMLKKCGFPSIRVEENRRLIVVAKK